MATSISTGGTLVPHGFTILTVPALVEMPLRTSACVSPGLPLILGHAGPEKGEISHEHEDHKRSVATQHVFDERRVEAGIGSGRSEAESIQVCIKVVPTSVRIGHTGTARIESAGELTNGV